MGKVSKGVICDIKGCENEAARSLSVAKVTNMSLKIQNKRRVYLCKNHYKDYKKGGPSPFFPNLKNELC